TDLHLLRQAGADAAAAWRAGDRPDCLATLRAAADVGRLASPGTGVLAPQAAVHLGHAAGAALLADATGGDHALALAAVLVASPHPGLRLLAPHLLTPLAASDLLAVARIVDLCPVCRDPATMAALVIPLTAAGQRDPAGLGRALTERLRHTPPGPVAGLVTQVALALRQRSRAGGRDFLAALARPPTSQD
ncbi:MAG: hypothetical protein FJ029_13480, partial [Actinobacteria bacterium]|nr:hypothetical protein [Actinomycetota bacterium]